jgi:hypothetical protein
VVLTIDSDWVISTDPSGELMAIRRDGSEVGRVAHGEIEVLAERTTDGELLTRSGEVALA